MKRNDYPLEWYCERCGKCTQWNNSGGWCYVGGDGTDFCPFEEVSDKSIRD